jgi:hypothetical protein
MLYIACGDDAAASARVLAADFTLDRIAAKSPADVAPAILAAVNAGTQFFLLDAPAEAFRRMTRALAHPASTARPSH